MADTNVNVEEVAAQSSNFSSGTVAVFIAEFLGTAGFLFLACMGQTGLIAGLAVTAMVQMFGHISGGHINPSVTLGAYIMGRISLFNALVYMCAQFLGSFCGYGLLRLLLENEKNTLIDGFCVTKINPLITSAQGMVIEMVLTAFLVFTVCTFGDSRNKSNTDSTPLRLGIILAGIFLAGGPLTGASLHPFKSFWPAVMENYWDDQWVYWVGPFVGSAIAALIYRYVFEPKA